MAQEFKKGDQVEWKAGQGKASGTVEKIISEPTEVDGNQIDASEDDPRYLVKNEHTGKVTGHTAEALSKVDNSSNQHTDDEREQHIKEFQEVVNMTAKELEKWLKTDESKSVGQKKDDDEAIGHKSGKYIVELLNKKLADYTDDDINQIKRVVSYVRRHSAQKPSDNIENSNWRYSLMNWGNDPMKRD